MKLTYKFETTNDVIDTRSVNYNSIEPPLVEEDDVEEYDYFVDVSVEDIADFLGVNLNEDTTDVLSKFIKMFGATLEEDSDFYIFMKDKYQEDAREEFEAM